MHVFNLKRDRLLMHARGLVRKISILLYLLTLSRSFMLFLPCSQTICTQHFECVMVWMSLILAPLLIAIKLPVLWSDVFSRAARPVVEGRICFNIQGAEGDLFAILCDAINTSL